VLQPDAAQAAPPDASRQAAAAPVTAPTAAADTTVPQPAINSARVLQSMQGSEMRVGMHTAEFGNVQISTSINTLATHQTMAAQLSFEHADLARMVTAHLPSIESKLTSESGMQTRLEVRDHSAAAGGDMGRQAGSGEQGAQRRSSGPGSGTVTSAAEATQPGALIAPPAATTSLAGMRLDIHI
jgi:hypothetical protein